MDLDSILSGLADNPDLDLTAATGDELATLRDQALDRYRTIKDDTGVSATDRAAALEQLVTVMTGVRTAEQTHANTRGAETALDDLFATGDDTDGGTPAPETTPEPSTPVLEGELLIPADTAPDMELAVATAARVDMGAVSRHNARDINRIGGTRPQGAIRERYEISTASAVPGISDGTIIRDSDTLVRAITARMSGMPRPGSGSPDRRDGIAVIKRTLSQDLTVHNQQEDAAVIDRAANERLLAGGSLLAANGWCGPAETDYNLCDSLTTREGLWDTPIVQMARSGLRYPVGWDFQSIASMLPGQILCAPDLAAGTQKQCVESPCPTWAEITKCAVPLCVKNDILQERSWPEGVRRFAEDVMDAYVHFINSYFLAQAANLATTVTPMSPAVPGAWHAVLDQLSLIVEYIRDYYRTSLNATMEAVAPAWLRGVMVADKAKQINGNNDIAESQLGDFFGRRGVRPQWVYGWQPLATGTGNPPVFNVPTNWPSSVTILLYPAGTFVRAQNEIISLSAEYSSPDIQFNKYLGLFQEDEVALVQRCYRAFKVTIPLCVNGAMGPQIDRCPTEEA